MDITSTLKNEVFRPLTSIIIPGSIAIGPYLFVIYRHFPGLALFAQNYSILFLFVVFASATAAGLVLEDIGGLIEDFWDCVLNKKQKDRKQYWHDYLKLKINDEYIGQRYLRTVHVRFKFELSTIPALLIFLPGFIWVNSLFILFQFWPMFWLCTTTLATAGYLTYESYDSAKVLGSCHKSIVKAVALSAQATQADSNEPTVLPSA
jgi:hypothetical protein